MLTMVSDEVTPEYQAEVDASMERLQRRYAKAQRALEAAEAKAERARLHAEELAAKQAEAERIAQHQADEESRLAEYIVRIKDAAQKSRVAEARAELERKHCEAIAQRNAATARRQAEIKNARQQCLLAAKRRVDLIRFESDASERRRELREIENLMMPGNYVGRENRGRSTAKHTTGARL